uniref:Uncharacterized protein n=1 Tax=Romanomermis culicivorax TaxID=13658 RepID=A0A915L050_ROMCU
MQIKCFVHKIFVPKQQLRLQNVKIQQKFSVLRDEQKSNLPADIPTKYNNFSNRVNNKGPTMLREASKFENGSPSTRRTKIFKTACMSLHINNLVTEVNLTRHQKRLTFVLHLHKSTAQNTIKMVISSKTSNKADQEG